MNTEYNSNRTEKKSTIRQLWHLTRGQRHLFAAAALSMIVANLCLFVPPVLGKYAIDMISQQDATIAMPALRIVLQYIHSGSATNLSALLWFSAVLSVLITLVAGAFQFTRGRCTALASEAIAEQLRLDLYARLHAAQARFFDQSQTGDLVQRCSSDVDTVRAFLGSNLVDISRSLLLVVCVVPVLFWIDTTLAWVSLCLMPLLVIGSYAFFARVKALFLASDEAEGRMTACLQENLTGIRVVRAFHRQEFEIAKFATCNYEYRECSQRMMTVMSIFWGISDFVSFTQIGLVLILGALLVQAGDLSLGDLFAFITYVSMVVWPIRHLGRVLVDSGMSMVALNRINHILLQPVEITGDTNPQTCASGAVHIEALSFSYSVPATEDKSAPGTADFCTTDTRSLHDISLEIQAGETLALVGAPGSGKTTLIAVLLKLYDYQHGSIKIDDYELRDLDRHWLRQQFAVVFQEPFLYSRSIANNLRVGKEQASDAELQKVCQQAALHESIMGFAGNYSALIGERGVTLSGGQRQRLALARALVKDAPFLILDDALSAVDSQTEKTILNALQARSGRRTTLIVAHRLSTLRHADRIAVMQDGKIAQLGTHTELSAQAGQYRRLCRIQNTLDNAIDAELEALEKHAASKRDKDTTSARAEQ